MYVKKNLILWAAVFALVLPLLLIGTAGATYMSDGAVQAAANGGWVVPTDGVCVLSIDMSGNLVTDATITNKRDCDARLVSVTAVTSGDTLANVCGKTGLNTSGVKYAAPGGSTCVTIDGSGYITGSKSMKDLDRNAQMCSGLGGQLANATPTTLSNGAVISTATKTTANGTAATCIAFGWQYAGQDATGAPLTFGAKGTTQGAGTGYCYTTMNMTTSYGTTTVPGGTSGTICPAGSTNSSISYDWAYSSSKCTYGKGIAGYVNSALTKADGTTYAAGTFLNMSTFTTLGACLANGGSWANWIGQAASTTSVPTTPLASTIPNWGNYSVRSADADDACLHCHSYKAQQNGPSERFKESYVKTGHKNMLRAVKAGMPWSGPDGVAYTTDGANTINFMTTSDLYAKVTVSANGNSNGDQNLYYIYGDWMAALPTLVYGATGTNSYGSAVGATNGYGCYACHATGVSDHNTTGTGANPGVQSIGTPGYEGLEPQATFPGINIDTTGSSAVTNPKWDLNGIQCSRCHNAATAPVSATQIAASSYKTTAPTSGGMGALAAGTGRNNLCFGCHQSIAKNWPAQGGAAGGTTQYDPTLIPTGINHGAAAGRDFNGHVLGNSFLNSVHAQYAGAQSGNGSISLNALGKFDLTDPNGTVEYQSTFQGYTCWQSPTSSSPGKTKADGSEIKTKADCEAIYGAGSWRSDSQGTCTTCHDVHNSLFVASQKEAAMRKTCEDCHVNNASTFATISTVPTVSTLHHPTGVGTPSDSSLYEESCVVCHMASQAVENGDQVSMPAHVWRINTNASYNTFPTVDQFNGTNGATKDRNAQTAADGPVTKAVWVDLDLACGQCHGGSLGTGATHNGALYISKAELAVAANGMHMPGVVSQPTYSTPVVSKGTMTLTGYMVSFTDTSTDGDGSIANISVNWGDGAISRGVMGGVFTHTYSNLRARSYIINHVAISSGNPRLLSAEKFSVNVPQRYTVSGLVTTSTGTPMGSAYVFLKQNGHTKQYKKTDVGGNYSFSNVLPGDYTIHVFKFGTTFGTDATITGLGSNLTMGTIKSITP